MANDLDTGLYDHSAQEQELATVPQLLAISLISHASKVMLKVILNRLKAKAEEIITEEQARFCSGRSTAGQIFNLCVLREKYSQHQHDIYHVLLTSKKHLTEWAMMHFGTLWENITWARN